LAPAVFRPVFRPLRAAARRPAPAFRFEGVFFWPFDFRVAFLAIPVSLGAA
jgi:hypothetical protein